MAVTSKILYDGPREICFLLTNDDGSGGNESGVTKFDRSATSHTASVAGGSVGIVPGMTLDRVQLKSCTWSIQGFTNVNLLWNFNAGDEMLIALQVGEGEFDLGAGASLSPSTSRDTAQAADGDVILTTENASAATDGYSIRLTLIKKWVFGA